MENSTIIKEGMVSKLSRYVNINLKKTFNNRQFILTRENLTVYKGDKLNKISKQHIIEKIKEVGLTNSTHIHYGIFFRYKTRQVYFKCENKEQQKSWFNALKTATSYFIDNKNEQEDSFFMVNNEQDKSSVDSSIYKSTVDYYDPEDNVEIEQLQENNLPKVTLQDFELLKVVGVGGFGKVMLVKKRNTKEVLAMKIIKKDFVIKNDYQNRIDSERQILEKIDNPFLTKLQYAFQNKTKLYFIIDQCPGGELFFLISRLGKLKEDMAKFQAAQIVLCFEYLHSIDIVQRDLKPENVLLDVDGQLKLTDFGLSKEEVVDKNSCNSICGTVEQMAPEVVTGKGHGKPVDWWTMGCFLYEMLTGKVPFHDTNDQNRHEIFDNILNLNIYQPEFISKDAKKIMKDFLTINPDKRLGGTYGAQKVKQHKWFKDINWHLLSSKKITPKQAPNLKSNTDTRYFESQFTDLPVNESIYASVRMSDVYFDNFSFDGNV